MGMNPDRFLEAFVQGNLWDCQDNPGDLRRAFNAAVSASHLADIFYEYNKRHEPGTVAPFARLGDFVEHLAKATSGDFRDLRSISNAYKHLYTAPHLRVHSTVLSGGALERVRIEGNDVEVDELESDYEEKGGDEAGRVFVRFKRKDGSTAEFLPVLESFLDYWCRTYG
jgi:hypothetical protein